MTDSDRDTLMPNRPDGESASTSKASKRSISPASDRNSPPIPEELENLPPEMKAAFSVMAGVFRSSTGPDPDTARIVAESEMHEESCRLEAYKENLKTRDRQNDRDHEFRKKKLNHESAKQILIIAVSIIGIVVALYLLVAKGKQTLGTALLVGAFMTLLNGRSWPSSKQDN